MKQDWNQEFIDITFRDKRPQTRPFKIMDAFAESSELSLYAAAEDRCQAKAMYRFLDNEQAFLNAEMQRIQGDPSKM